MLVTPLCSGIDLTSDDYLGLGLEAGLLKVVWNLGWFSRTELVVPDRNLTDGAWHSLRVKRARQQMDVMLDELSYVSQVQCSAVHCTMCQVHGTYHELNTENKVMIGGAKSGVLVEDLTRGHFRCGQSPCPPVCRSGFSGCLREVQVQGAALTTTGSPRLRGQAVGECPGA
jgi:hypothetical protein